MANLCGDCGVKPGMRHKEGCDVARCLATGQQRLQCGGEEHKYHGQWYGEHEGTCGFDIWTGLWPGVAECRELNLYTKPDQNGNFSEDLNELYRMVARNELRWDRAARRFVRA